MNLSELRERLSEEGYDHLIHQYGPEFLAINDFCIKREQDHWQVCYTERGEVVEMCLDTATESEACLYWYGRMQATFLFLKGTRDAAEASQLQSVLESKGIDVHRNDIPHCDGPNDVVYRIFVAGQDLKQAAMVVADARPTILPDRETAWSWLKGKLK